MRKLFLLASILAFGLMALSGCNPRADIPGSVQDDYARLGQAAREAKGDYDKLSADDKKLFLKRTNGDEKGAREMVSTMSGPGERRSRK